VNVTSIVLALSVFGGAACATQGDDGDDVVDVSLDDAKADTARTVSVTSGSTVTVQFTATGSPLDVSVDCSPPADPDTAGMQFTVTRSA
jgi:hypothetical protein